MRARDGRVAADEFFFAEQNARLVRNAEEYYRTMFRGHVASWNLRDRHMAETLDALAGHLAAAVRAGEDRRLGAQLAPGRRARHARWARRGELNVGQLARERYGQRNRARSASPPTTAR